MPRPRGPGSPIHLDRRFPDVTGQEGAGYRGFADMDVFSDKPAQWEVGGPLADEYSWLVRNGTVALVVLPRAALRAGWSARGALRPEFLFNVGQRGRF